MGHNKYRQQAMNSKRRKQAQSQKAWEKHQRNHPLQIYWLNDFAQQQPTTRMWLRVLGTSVVLLIGVAWLYQSNPGLFVTAQ